MKKHRIPKIKLSSSLTVNRIITGLWQIADMERDNNSLNLDLIANEMASYVDLGLTSFDMADHYGSAEEISGIYNQKFRSNDEVQFLTKYVPEPGPISFEDVNNAINRSLRRLKIEQIDLLQYHAWNYYDPSWLDALFYLQELKNNGKIKNIGVTNFDTTHLRIALTSKIEIVSNQICYSLIDQRAKYAMTDLCKEFNVQILAYGTLAGGFLSEKWIDKSEPKKPLTWSQMKYKRFINAIGGWEKYQALISKLNEIAIKKNVSIANLATKFILQQPQVASVIVGARLGENRHIDSNLNILNFDLAEGELQNISMLINNLLSIPGDCGDEYRKAPYLTATGDLSHHVSENSSPYEVMKDGDRKYILSGTEWEYTAGYSRAISKNNRIIISGTTAMHKDRDIGIGDIIAQTNYILDKIIGALISLGGKVDDIIRTRIYVSNLDNWEVVARIHGERFRKIKVANTMVIAGLIGEHNLVEIEAEADI